MIFINGVNVIHFPSCQLRPTLSEGPVTTRRKAPQVMNTHDPRIIHWQQGEEVQNFGDFLTVILAKELFLYPRLDADIYRIVGSCIAEWMIWQDLSVLDRQEYGRIAYWGCGLRDESPIPPTLLERCRFFGVRGPLTRDLLGLPKDTPLADPGLLAPLYHTPRTNVMTQGKTICMPHINDEKSDEILLAMSGADAVVHPTVDNNEEALRTVLDKIASADFLLTGSLHGAILACAYGVPFAFWDNGHVDIILKWRDFAGSVGIGTIFVKDVKEGVEAYRQLISPNLKLPPLTSLLEVCPFEIKPSVRLKAFLHDSPDKAVSIDDAIMFFDQSFSENVSNRALMLQDSLSYRNDVTVWASKQMLALQSLIDDERRHRMETEANERALPALQAELAAVYADVEKCRSKSAGLEAQLTSLAAEHAALVGSADELARGLEIRHAERDALHRELGELGQAERTLRSHADALEAQLSSLTTAHSVLNAKADELSRELVTLQAERGALDNALRELGQVERTGRFRIEHLKAKLASMTTERSPLLARIIALEDDVMTRQVEREALGRQLAMLNQRLASLHNGER